MLNGRNSVAVQQPELPVYPSIRPIILNIDSAEKTSGVYPPKTHAAQPISHRSPCGGRDHVPPGVGFEQGSADDV